MSRGHGVTDTLPKHAGKANTSMLLANKKMMYLSNADFLTAHAQIVLSPTFHCTFVRGKVKLELAQAEIEVS